MVVITWCSQKGVIKALLFFKLILISVALWFLLIQYKSSLKTVEIYENCF